MSVRERCATGCGVWESVMRKTVLMAGLLAAAVTMGGCTRIKVAQGYIVDETLITSIQAGVDNRESVEKTLGRPTLASQFDSKQWYYISRNTGQYAFAQPKVLSQSVLVVSFDEAGNVSSVERRGLEQVANIDPEKDKTPTLGRDSNFFEDIFGNIGSVGAAGGGAGPNGNVGRDGPR